MNDPRATIWKEWKTLPAHPAAAKLPMQSSAQIDETAQRIKKNGMRESLVVFVDNKEEANGAKGPFPMSLLDGRNRREALIRLGVDSPKDVWASPVDRRSSEDSVRVLYAIERTATIALGKGAVGSTGWKISTDPEEYVLDVNVHRRHLTPEQKREAIASFIEADPKASDSAIAKKLKVSDHTVKDVRKKSSSSNPQNANLSHLPLERAKAAVRENPSASASEIAKIADVSRATAQRAQKPKKQGQGVKPEPESKKTTETTTKSGLVEAKLVAMWKKYRDNKVTPDLFRQFVSDAVEVPGSVSIVKSALEEFPAKSECEASDERRQAKAEEPEINLATLSMSTQQKCEAWKRQTEKRLRAEIAEEERKKVRNLWNEDYLPHYKEELDKAVAVQEAWRGVFDKKTYTKIMSCLHSDWVTDPTQKQRYDEAFVLFKSKERILLSEKELPTASRVTLPKTYEEWMKRKAEVAAARKAKRAAARSSGIEKK